MSTKVNIDGNENVVIQKVEGSTITINPSVLEEVRKALHFRFYYRQLLTKWLFVCS